MTCRMILGQVEAGREHLKYGGLILTFAKQILIVTIDEGVAPWL